VCSAETCKLPVCSDVHSGFQWIVCKDGFNAGSVLKSQIVPHSEEDPVNFQACGKSFQYTCEVENQNREKSFRCNICEKRFSQFGNLKRHFLTHTGNKPFKCDICGKFFSRSAHVKDHILTHTGIGAFKCDSCDRAFLKSEHLEFHMYTHTGEKPFKCDMCGKVFSRRGHLTVHYLMLLVF
jgi:KRAB domain-containing zinc finger protein